MEIYMGLAQKAVTPDPSEVFLDGYGFRTTSAAGVQDELYVKCCAVTCGGQRYAMITLDVCGFNEEVLAILYGHIAAVNALPLSHVSLFASHTHASLAGGVLNDLPINRMAWHDIGKKSAFLVKEAFDNQFPACVQTYMPAQIHSIQNRRFSDLADKRVKVLGITDSQGQRKGVIVNASCHAVAHSDNTISADYPGVLAREMQRLYPGVPVLFLQGRAADVNPVLDIPDMEPGEKLGLELFDAVQTTLEHSTASETLHDAVTIQVLHAFAEIPMKEYPDAGRLAYFLEQNRQQFYQAESRVEGRFPLRAMLWYQGALAEVSNGLKAPKLTVPLQIVSIASLLFIMLPFELFVQTGNAIERYVQTLGYNEDHIFICGYANGTYGYLVPNSEIAKGGYEVDDAPIWYGLPMCSELSEETVVETVKGMLKDLADLGH